MNTQWEKRFDRKFGCYHHPAQCDGDCQDEYKSFIHEELKQHAILLMSAATDLARSREQSIGEKSDLYITLEQLNDLLKNLNPQ